MAIIMNPLGEDGVKFIEESSAKRTGKRIQAIRNDREMTTGKLAEMVGLTSDRIHKYESGYRMPRADMLQQISDALDVNTLSLIDAPPVTYISTMFVFFELEQKYGFKPEMVDGKLVLSLDNDSIALSDYLKKWYERINSKESQLRNASAEEEKAAIEKDYRIWKYSFPESIAINKGGSTKKDKILEEIKKLQEQLDQLDEGE